MIKNLTAGLMALSLAGLPAAAFAQDYESGAEHQLAVYKMEDEGSVYTGDTTTPSPTKGKWVKTAEGWYFQVNGEPLKDGIYRIDKKYYWFNNTGLMQKGWRYNPDDTISYFRTSGERIDDGWLNLSSKWYYFNESGLLQAGPIVSNDTLYYADKDGVMMTGWISNPNDMDATMIFADNSGKICEGWKYIPGPDGGAKNWYYFWPESAAEQGHIPYDMAANTWIYNADGTAYFVNDAGVWVQ